MKAISITPPRDAWPLFWAFLIIALCPLAAFAHTGTAATPTFAMGLSHPIGGADHVLAMVTVGLWAALSGGRALWAMPLAFLLAMLCGGAVGHAGVPLPGVEPMILASIIVLGAAAALALRLPMALSLAAIALFGVAHGHAHGAEGPAGGLAGYAAGFVLATAALHLAGLLAGLGLARAGHGGMVRLLGAGSATGGLALLFG